MLNSISIFGTSSDSGKSTITFIIAKMLQDLGYKVAPFKAQNVSNNSRVADDGGEIAIAQSFQAEVLGIKTSYHMNPILLKSGHGNSASLIINGKPSGEKDVRDYYKDLDRLKPIVDKSFEYLNKKYDLLVCEGAGSPVELNLMDKDLSNIYVASKFNTKIILVADIERGGLFASVWGTYNLLPKKLQKNVIGVVVNKFRGDMTLFDNGIKIIEKEFGIPILGVLPYKDLNLGFEDSQSLLNYTQKGEAKINIGIIRFPHISNYNDFEPLILDDEVNVDFIQGGINRYDMLILPGTKRTINDLKWLKRTSLFKEIKKFNKPIIGICGGYQMMFENIIDKNGIEDIKNSSESGFGFVKDDIVFKKKKRLKKKTYFQFDFNLKGYEIRHGKPKRNNSFIDMPKIKGTFVHSVFDNDNLRTAWLKSINKKYKGYNFIKYKRDKIDDFVNEMAAYLDISKVIG